MKCLQNGWRPGTEAIHEAMMIDPCTDVMRSPDAARVSVGGSAALVEHSTKEFTVVKCMDYK